MDTVEQTWEIENESFIAFNSKVVCEVFGIGAPHIENESFKTVRFVMLMKARPNCPKHLIMVLLSLPPTREMLLTF